MSAKSELYDLIQSLRTPEQVEVAMTVFMAHFTPKDDVSIQPYMPQSPISEASA